MNQTSNIPSNLYMAQVALTNVRATDTFDIAIVGGGPAGSSLAIRLASRGQKVLLVEQKKFPREKLCGEFISPECLAHFAELGVLPSISASGGTNIAETIFFARNGKGVAVPSEWFGNADSLALGLSRAEMDAQLLERAGTVGVDVRAETTATPAIENNVVSGLKLRSKNGEQRQITARLTVDATGRTRSLARRFEQSSSQTAATHVAFKTHLTRANIDPSVCEIYAYKGGYGGCNLVENGYANLCFIATAADTKRLGSDAERVMHEIVFANSRAKEAMKNAVAAKPWLAVPIERFGRGKLVPANGLITVGDAASFIDPFTGSGILLALESAKITADAITTTNFDFQQIAKTYERKYTAAFGLRLRVCSMLRHAAFVPFLAEATISLLGVSSVFRRRLVRATRLSA